MLLPSDVARLVLGYLQEEGLTATSQAFILESPNLKEYADHTIGDGAIPACLFSVFGKGLTTILNEYVATKTKESCHEVPAVMTSLWKKLDYTLNQIKSMQNSPTISACQRIRSRIGVANMARQRVLTVASTGAVVCSSVSEVSPFISPAHSSHGVLSHSTPAGYTAQHNRPAVGSGSLQQVHDVRLNTLVGLPVQTDVPEQRLNPGPTSPGRRKGDTLKKKGGIVSGSGGAGRYATNASGLSAESQIEQAVDENFPQLVIQNARDRILGDRSLQEKLAENINKILAIDPMPQMPKASSSAVEPEQSLDEILGLQGEIHMSDDAIHDILEQTESDPAFQALYELFDYSKTKFTDGGPEIVSNSPEDGDPAEPSPAARPLQSEDPDITQKDDDALASTPVKVKTGHERKNRKSSASTLLKKKVLSPRGKSSRIENCSARVLIPHREEQDASSAPADAHGNGNASLLNNGVFVTPMEISEPLNAPPPPSDSIACLELAFKDTSTTTAQTCSTAVPSSDTPSADVDKEQEHKRAQGPRETPAAAPLSQTDQLTFLSPVPFEPSGAPTPSADLPQISISSSGGDSRPVLTFSLPPESASPASVSTAAPFTATPASPASASPSATPTATSASHVASTSCAASDPLTADRVSPGKPAADSNVVSLKIIISDNHSEESSSDPVLKQAVSSISRENIPTIFLSSPAKSPRVPGTPKNNFDEVAQAVSGLQSSEVHGSPLGGKAGALLASPLTGTSQIQQNYIIQLPLETATPALQGTAPSYFLVTEPLAKDAQSRPVLLSAGLPKGQPLPINQFGVPTPANSQAHSTAAGSALILPSPVKPIILPVSVVGQNTVGKIPVVSNQLVAIPNPVPVQQSETVKPKSPTVAVKLTTAATDQHLVGNLVQPVSDENTDQRDTATGFKHKRMLCFDSSSEVQPQTAKTTTATFSPATNTSPSVQQSPRDDAQSGTRTKPAILCGNKSKRRIQTVKCPADPQTDRGLVKETPVPPQQGEKANVKKNCRKQDHGVHNGASRTESHSGVEASQPKKSESKRKSKSTDRKQSHPKDGDGAEDPHRSRSLSCDPEPEAGTRKEKEESKQKEPVEKAPAKPRVGRTERRTPSQEMPNVTANKENEIKGSMQDQQQPSTPSASRDFSPPAVSQPASEPQPKAAKASSKTSSLAKQAAEMLHGIQGLGSPSTPDKKATEAGSDLSVPRITGTSRNPEGPADSPRTPSRQRRGKDGEGTPKSLIPPSTSDVTSCSPASEAGSENSINMAAHTLMILSRAAIARTGTPLKDSLRQEGAGEKLPARAKNSKKRKLPSPTVSPPAKKERERKKLIDCFPHDLDVDKFLSSLHYDE